MRNQILTIGSSLLLLTACNLGTTQTTPGGGDSSATATSTVATNTDGYTSIFDGTSIAGWHRYGNTGAGNWKIADGALYLDTAGTEGGDLVTDKEYENFDLKLEWKIAPNGNSGIIFLVHEDTVKYPATYNTGPEMQVLDNDGHPDGKIIKHRSGDLYDLIACNKETVKPVGEWNEARIVVNKGQLDLYLNGNKAVSTMMWDDEWKKMLAASKFNSMPGFGTFKKGRIALQDHGNLVWFRNISIKEL